ncbi:MAG: response regulator transcription factor [Acidimicrobiales bacterium]
MPGGHPPVTVVVVDDHKVLAEALAIRLSVEEGIQVLRVVSSGREVATVVASARPRVVVMDVELGESNGIDLTRRIRAQPDPPAVVVLTGHTDDAVAVEAIRAGAAAVVTKDSPTEHLIAAIRAVERGEVWLASGRLAGVIAGLQAAHGELSSAERLLDRLSPREQEVLTLMVRGLNRTGMANALHRSPNTIRTHTQAILAKLDAHSSVEAVGIALRAGLRPGRP